jgi:hypothetical protein
MLKLRALKLKCPKHPRYNGRLANFHASCRSCEYLYRLRLILADTLRHFDKPESDVIRDSKSQRPEPVGEITGPLFEGAEGGSNGR